MTEAFVINLFFTIRVFLVGAIMYFLPHILRRHLIFGTYMRENAVDQTAVRDLMHAWHKGCLTVMFIALAVGWSISLAGWPLHGNLIGTGVLLLAALANYLLVHHKARQIEIHGDDHGDRQSVATLVPPNPAATRFARITLVTCIALSAATLLYAAIAYRSMPSQIPSLVAPLGPEGLHAKSFVAVIMTPALNLVFTTFLALIAMFTSTAKRSVRSGDAGDSVAAQDDFRTSMSNVTSWTALLICISLALLTVQMTRVGLSQIESIGLTVYVVVVGLLVFVIQRLLRIFRKQGQGGAFQEIASANAPLEGGLADNSHWVWGLFFVDREDPSIMVEKRFGFGYTFNYGNPLAVTVVTVFVTLMLGLIVAALVTFLP